MSDYLEDLSMFPIEIVEEACKRYRRQPGSRFFPKVGELTEIMAPMMKRHNEKLTRERLDREAAAPQIEDKTKMVTPAQLADLRQSLARIGK
jgi:hypothetical protein